MQDELLWGAAWLHRATKNSSYLNYIQENGQNLGGVEFDNTFGWDNKHVGARILLSKVFFLLHLVTTNLSKMIVKVLKFWDWNSLFIYFKTVIKNHF